MNGERGAAPVELAAGVALLVLPALLLVVSFVPWVVRRLDATRLAVSVAREAAFGARAAPPVPVGSVVTVSRVEGVLGEEVRVEVRLPVPVVQTPWGPIGVGWARGTHTEVVGPHRSRP